MAQPRKVRQAAAEAERLHKEAYGDKNAPQTDDQQAEKPNLNVVEGQQEEQEEQTSQEQQFDAPTGEAEGVVQPPPSPPKADDKGDDYWERRFKTQEGIHRKVVDDNRQLREELAELRGAMTTLTQMQGSAKAAPEQDTPAQTQARHLLKPEEIADYGEDLIDVMKRAAREAVQGELEILKRENKTLKDSLGSFQQANADKARNDVYGTLQTKVPNWQDINTDEDFLQWLNAADLFAGQPRGKLLREAFENNDAARVVAFFEAFLNEQQTVTPDQSAASAPPQQQPARKLETMVAPGKPRGGAAQAQGDQKRMWSQDDIQQFYQQVHKGKFHGREKEQRAIEQDIIAATKEGRIRF